jgi:uncharacterized membrane protein HdeD (DUF308 family)
MPLKIDHVLIAYMTVVGAVTGVVVAMHPQLKDFRISPYFWVLVALGLFELANFARGRGAPGTMIAMEARLLGFVLAIVLMVVIPLVAAPLLKP